MIMVLIRRPHRTFTRLPGTLCRFLDREALLIEQLQLVFHLFAAHLGIPDRGLNGRHTAFNDMSRVIGHLFQVPAGCALNAQNRDYEYAMSALLLARWSQRRTHIPAQDLLLSSRVCCVLDASVKLLHT